MKNPYRNMNECAKGKPRQKRRIKFTKPTGHRYTHRKTIGDAQHVTKQQSFMDFYRSSKLDIG